MTDKTTSDTHIASGQDATRKPFRRLLLTGAAGNLGKQLRGALAAWAEIVRVSDIAPLGELAGHEEAAVVDLADQQAVHALLEG
ncbi:MAG: NAD(P)-dependent oxidoreductase, partial [Paraburkholderia sp.]